MDVVVPSRKSTTYTGKVHNPRKIWDDAQANAKKLSSTEFQASTREAMNTRVSKIERDIATLVKFVGEKADEQGHLLTAVNEIKSMLEGMGSKKKVKVEEAPAE